MKNDGILELGIKLSSEKNQNTLLNTILLEAMKITHADRGTLYTLENDKLFWRITKNLTMKSEMGFHGEPVPIPPIPMKDNYFVSFAALKQKLVSVDNIYKSNLFNFSRTFNYDKTTGYHTKSMMAVPLIDNKLHTIGVLQLVNSLDKNGVIMPFPKSVEKPVQVLASFSNIALSNMIHELEMKRQMFSFFDVIISAIDERSPYNSTHTVRIVEILIAFLDYVEKTPKATEVCGKITHDRKETIIMSAWLHDIGKLVTPLEILNKSTRLEGKEKTIKKRMERICLLAKIDFLEKKINKEQFNILKKETIETFKLVQTINNSEFLTDDILNQVQKIAKRSFVDVDNISKNWLTNDEVEALSIIIGTLTENERKIIEDHASMTTKLLSKMAFSSKYKNVLKWAGAHHELLNGNGYPLGIKADSIPTEVRILTILDIFEALTTEDRPYRKQITIKEAFSVLWDMQKCGEIDGKILKIFEESKCWNKPVKMNEYLKTELSLF